MTFQGLRLLRFNLQLSTTHTHIIAAAMFKTQDSDDQPPEEQDFSMFPSNWVPAQQGWQDCKCPTNHSNKICQ